MTIAATRSACGRGDQQHRQGADRRHQLEDPRHHTERDRGRRAEQQEAGHADDADDHAGGDLRPHVSGERAVDVAQVLFEAPLQVPVRQHAERGALEGGRAGQQQERDDRRHHQPARVLAQP